MYLKCILCVKAKKDGEDVKMTHFARVRTMWSQTGTLVVRVFWSSPLTNHLRRQHNVSQGEALELASMQRNKKSRSKGGRRVFHCRCGVLVVKKRQHLMTSRHPELAGVGVEDVAFQEALGAFRKVIKGTRRYRPERREEEGTQEERERREEEGAEEEREEREEMDEREERDDEDSDWSGEGEGDVEEKENEVLSREYVLALKKHQKVMKGKKDFEAVKKWGAYLSSRVGGSVDEKQTSIAMMMINRFLALVGYTEGGDFQSVLGWTSHVEIHDKYLVETFQPGTVKSTYAYVKRFLDWLREEALISDAEHSKANTLFSKLTSATRKAAHVRSIRRRRQEEEVLPKDGVDVVEEHFNNSNHVNEVLSMWRDGDASMWKPMRGILLQQMAFRNGSRCGEFRNLRYKHLLNPRPFKTTTDRLTIVLDEHKTCDRFTAMIHLRRDTFKDLRDYVTVTRPLLYGPDRHDDEDFVFHAEGLAGKNTDPVPHTYLNRWLQSTWKTADMTTHYPGYVASCTGNRKLVTTDVRQIDPDKADEVAHMLCHRRSTADAHYDMTQQIERSQNMYSWMVDRQQTTRTSTTTSTTTTTTSPTTTSTTTTSPTTTSTTTTSPTTTSTTTTTRPTTTPDDLQHSLVKSCFVKLYRLDETRLNRLSTLQTRPTPTPQTPTDMDTTHTDTTDLDDEVDERVEEMQSALDDYNDIITQADDDCIPPTDDEADTRQRLTYPTPRKHVLPRVWVSWTKMKKRRFFTEAETQEISEIYKDDIQESANTNTTVPKAIIVEKRGGRWPEYSNDQIREKVRNLALKRRPFFWGK